MKRTLIIAEAGVNHNGDINTAFRLVDAACRAGADYVKFQTFKADKLVSKLARKAEYQSKNDLSQDSSQYAMLKRLELTEEDHHRLLAYCERQGIKFLSTGFDTESLEFLASLGIVLCKIPSGEITNLPYLRKAASLFQEIIISTGMAELREVWEAVYVFLDAGISRENIKVLHCNTEYPTPMKDVNLSAMLHLRDTLQVETGYSDHTLGIEVPVAAVALGAVVIEKHFTLNKNGEGPDHKASLEPHELKQMVDSIRNVELAMAGSGMKEPSGSERKNLTVARKSIHLNTHLKKGTVVSESDLIMLRPGDGISPFDVDKVIGKRVKADLRAFHKMSWSDLI